jgi:hypothetical protein
LASDGVADKLKGAFGPVVSYRDRVGIEGMSSDHFGLMEPNELLVNTYTRDHFTLHIGCDFRTTVNYFVSFILAGEFASHVFLRYS